MSESVWRVGYRRVGLVMHREVTVWIWPVYGDGSARWKADANANSCHDLSLFPHQSSLSWHVSLFRAANVRLQSGSPGDTRYLICDGRRMSRKHGDERARTRGSEQHPARYCCSTRFNGRWTRRCCQLVDERNWIASSDPSSYFDGSMAQRMIK